MNKLNILKYDLIIYICLFFAFTGAILSCIEPSSSVKQEEIAEPPKITSVKEPDKLKNVDKFGIAKKHLDSILDQITTDNVLTYEMLNSWESYNINKMLYKKEIMANYYQYEVDIQISGSNIIIPPYEHIIVNKTKEYTTIKLLMHLHFQEERNGYIVKSVNIPSEK